MARYALGLDFGTNSARALIADVATGAEAAAAVSVFPSGEEGVVLDERNDLLARQHPNDWLIAMERAVRSAMKKARGRRSFSPERVIGIGVDTTGSTPLPLDRSGVPLAMHRRFGKELAAMAWLWKDHTSYQEAAEITALAKKRRPAFLKKCGGAYSSEWFFSKILHCMRTSPEVFEAAYTWAECSDYIPAVLTGTTSTELMKRNSCAAGHKCMYNESWGGLPDKKFLGALAPKMAELRGRLFERAVPADRPAGGLSKEWARRLRLVEGTPVAVGSIDAHMGALGSGVAPGTLVKIIGTSTCDMMVAPKNKPLPDIPGIAGIADDSIIPGMYGLEAGQSAVGDIFNWFVRELAPRGMSHDELTARALRMKPGECGLLALDWNNGNRNVLADFRLTGMLLGQTLHTGAAEVYRALIEATAFGARMIVERVEEYGVKVRRIVTCGGISEKNALLLQVYADVLGRPIRIARSSQAPALGACITAAAAAGAHPSVQAAQKAMAGVKKKEFKPEQKSRRVYNELFELYTELHDAFGGVKKNACLGPVMKRLLAIKDKQSGKD